VLSSLSLIPLDLIGETQSRQMGRTMETVPIKDDRHYRRILEEIDGLMHAARNSPEGNRLDMLATLVEAWEAKYYSIDQKS
jgi:antitoxin component HigA of HigAB toxin-antitoxin module